MEDEVPVEEKEEEPAVEEEETDEEEKEGSEGFFHKIKNMFSGGKKDQEPSEDEKEEEPSEEGPSDEGEATGEEEQPAEEDDVPEEPVKEEKEEAGIGPLGIAGISVNIQEKLVSAGYHNVDEIKEAVPSDLMMIEGVGKKTAERICDAVKE